MDIKDISKYISNSHLKILVKPNSNKTEIIGYDNGKKALRVNISEPADKNKANIEVIKFFSKLLGRKVLIKSGLTSKEKLLLIVG